MSEKNRYKVMDLTNKKTTGYVYVKPVIAKMIYLEFVEIDNDHGEYRVREEVAEFINATCAGLTSKFNLKKACKKLQEIAKTIGREKWAELRDRIILAEMDNAKVLSLVDYQECR